MNRARLEQILAKLAGLKIIVCGDYFLDNYLTLDRTLSEPSLETGLEAYQVVETRKYPGVAGVVTANLRALGAQVLALGVIGDDGNGYELRKKLEQDGVDVRGLLQLPGLATPTYNKPMMREPDGGEHELNRMDVRFRASLEDAIVEQMIDIMNGLWAEASGMLIVDQARSPNCGVVTDRLRLELECLAAADPGKVIVADSRQFLGLFKAVILKANLSEALRAAGETRLEQESAVACAERCGRILAARTGRPVVITLGEGGIFLLQAHDGPGIHIPAIPVVGPVDIVGAGDSVNASVGAALCAGATLDEAGFLGNMVASIVIQQIGVTGVATPEQVRKQFLQNFEG